ncbi:MAG TPA: helix-turn-helix transcriptional regulator [Steroidobacter sp.]|jgi:XRE family aerobic/anaerobic benzoate catabolism transcriptional regulator|nr:helix-turn-helix transcriptional regulator [Steroidobacter sp.]
MDTAARTEPYNGGMSTRKPRAAQPDPDREYRERLASRLREVRAARGTTRAALVDASGVSLRFLAQIEAGRGNPSLAVMRKIARALAIPLESLIAETKPASVDRLLLEQSLNRMTPEELGQLHALIADRFSDTQRTSTRAISLIGLRGAGKSTLGGRLARHLGVEFVELDREVEREYGATIGEILQLHGQPGYRRYEVRCLLATLDRHGDCVIETGGGLVTDAETLSLLLERTRVVWLRATPEEHMQRVIDQGDLRPMAKSKEAMKDLRAILKAREPYYSRAPLHLNTSRKSIDATFEDLLDLLDVGRPPREHLPCPYPGAV